MSYVKMK